MTDETIRYRAEKTLANFDLNDEDLENVIEEWVNTPMPENCSPDFPIVMLEKIAFKHMLKRKDLWDSSRSYHVTYVLPEEN